MKCGRCKYEWVYNGKATYYACCPRCKSNVKIKKDAMKGGNDK